MDRKRSLYQTTRRRLVGEGKDVRVGALFDLHRRSIATRGYKCVELLRRRSYAPHLSAGWRSHRIARGSAAEFRAMIEEQVRAVSPPPFAALKMPLGVIDASRRNLAPAFLPQRNPLSQP